MSIHIATSRIVPTLPNGSVNKLPEEMSIGEKMIVTTQTMWTAPHLAITAAPNGKATFPHIEYKSLYDYLAYEQGLGFNVVHIDQFIVVTSDTSGGGGGGGGGDASAANQIVGNGSLASILANQTNGTQRTIVAAAVVKTNRSSVIATGGVAQDLAPANAARRGYQVYNMSSNDLWISEVGSASAGIGSIKIAPGGYYDSPITGVTSGAISIFGATTNDAFTAWEF